MKKELFTLFVLIFIIIISSIISAAVEISCSNNTKPLSDLNEIKIGNAKAINELGIGVTKSTESPFYKRVSAELLIDTKKSTVSNETPSETVELLTGNYTLNFVKANSTTATISIGGDTKDISLNNVEIVKGVYVMITNIKLIETSPEINFIIGSQQITLTNDQTRAQKVAFNNKSFIIEISSASETEALIRVSKCLNSEINLEGQEGEENEKPNKKPTPEIRSPEPNESTIQVSVAEFNARKNNQSLEANRTIEQIIKPKVFFSRIWNWIKNLFKFKNRENKNNLSNITEIRNISNNNTENKVNKT